MQYFEDLSRANSMSSYVSANNNNNKLNTTQLSYHQSHNDAGFSATLRNPTWSLQFTQQEELKIAQAVMNSGCINAVGLQIPVISNWNIQLFQDLATSTHDREVATFLKYGWPLNRQPGPVSQTYWNHKSALQYETQVTANILKEFKHNTMLGPFASSPFPQEVTGVSPMSTRAKKYGHQRRLLVDLSWPPHGQGHSVNSLIPKDSFMMSPVKLQFPTSDLLCRRAVELGPMALGYKKDMSRAFRQIFLDYSFWCYLAVYWMKAILFNKATVMGCRSAPYMCQRTTTCIRHFLANINYIVFNYIDDFMGMELPHRVWNAYITLGNLLRDLGVQEAEDKAVPPTTVLKFLGITYDLLRQILILPEEKMSSILTELRWWCCRDRKLVNKKQLQRLAGKLQFAAIVIRPGRVFITRLFEKIAQIPNDHDAVKLDACTMKDIIWWHKYMVQFNGVSMMWLESSSGEKAFSTDACLTGIGGKFRNEYFWEEIPETWKNLVKMGQMHILHVEMMALVIATKLWKHYFNGLKIEIDCDNMGVLEIINRGRARDMKLQQMLRELTFVTATHHCEIHVKYIRSEDNLISDRLSRAACDERSFQILQQMLKENPEWIQKRIPEHYFELNSDW